MSSWLNYKEEETLLKKNSYFPATKECLLFNDGLDDSRLQPEWKPPALSRNCVIKFQSVPRRVSVLLTICESMSWRWPWLYHSCQLFCRFSKPGEVKTINCDVVRLLKTSHCFQLKCFLPSAHFNFPPGSTHPNVFPWAAKCLFLIFTLTQLQICTREHSAMGSHQSRRPATGCPSNPWAVSSHYCIVPWALSTCGLAHIQLHTCTFSWLHVSGLWRYGDKKDKSKHVSLAQDCDRCLWQSLQIKWLPQVNCYISVKIFQKIESHFFSCENVSLLKC